MNSAASVPSIFDTQSLATLKKDLNKSDPKALKAVAQQFEAVFLQMVMKSMRAATPQDGPFDSDQTRFYQELLDSQLAQVLATRSGTGLAAVIERQLSRTDALGATEFMSGIPLVTPARPMPMHPLQRGFQLPGEKREGLPLESSPVRQVVPNAASPGSTGDQAQTFVASVLPHAIEASRQTGIPAQFLVAHAALESGWGRSEPRHADGRPSHNLFGIKATGGWTGEFVEATTTEYVNGVPERSVERFRAYGSYAEAFQDYARILGQSPRYSALAGTKDAVAFARGLQQGGYATDPAYAAKLERIITAPTLQAALARLA